MRLLSKHHSFSSPSRRKADRDQGGQRTRLDNATSPHDKLAAIVGTAREDISAGEIEAIISDILLPLRTYSTKRIATLAGADYRGRQRIKRKADRWAKGFSRMLALERLTVLSAIADAIKSDSIG